MRYSEKLKHYMSNHPITSLILLVNFVMTLILWLDGNFSLSSLVKYGGLNPILITQYHEYYRLITVMFLHGSLIHFLLNSFAIYYIAGQMELMLGPLKYALLYFISGLGSSALVVLLGDPLVVTVGASGAIFGILGGMLMLTFTRTKWFTPSGIRSIRQLTIINLAITFLLPTISKEGHIGGLLTGIILFYFITPEIPYYYAKLKNKKINVTKKDQFDY
ncbi:MAG: rhomboid family intramembrane serine protease [Firmicutes bacterium]|nr:rhomboid family intramembrane serine protease [Bacillota bacterium]